MFGYRTGETPVVQVHVKKPKPFKWLRKLFRRIKFKHARFDDGKYSRGQRDIEKWNEDTPLAKADYPDHRWQVVTRPRSRRGRSKNRDLKAPSSQSKAKPNREVSEGNKGRNSNMFMNMDALKHVLDIDAGYPSDGHSRTGNGPTTRAEVHQSPSWPNRCRENVSHAAKSAEESVRAHLSGYNTLDEDFSPVPNGKNKRRKPATNNAKSHSYPPSTIFADTTIQKQHNEPSCLSTSHAMYHLEGSFPQTYNDQVIQDHDNENDLNHLRVFEKRRFNKKPKNRKSKKRRPRRKGKYVELETAPSCESLDEVPHEVQGQKSPRKNETMRQSAEQTLLSNPLHSLVVGLRNLADAPVFHPAKYRGYKRFFDE